MIWDILSHAIFRLPSYYVEEALLWTLLADPKSMCLAANKAQSASFGGAARQMEHEISFTG